MKNCVSQDNIEFMPCYSKELEFIISLTFLLLLFPNEPACCVSEASSQFLKARYDRFVCGLDGLVCYMIEVALQTYITVGNNNTFRVVVY